jgi:hypothetical protein
VTLPGKQKLTHPAPSQSYSSVSTNTNSLSPAQQMLLQQIVRPTTSAAPGTLLTI